jgi:hypothetical protein
VTILPALQETWDRMKLEGCGKVGLSVLITEKDSGKVGRVDQDYLLEFQYLWCGRKKISV